MYKFFIKRIFEFTIALLALFMLLPIFLTISILVLLKMGTPIFFIQSRPGLNGKTFKMYKFRTMTNKCDKNENFWRIRQIIKLRQLFKIYKFG